MVEKYIKEELIQLDVQVETREEIIDQLAELMETHGYVKDTPAFLDAVFSREKTGSTSVGSEVAIPHGKSEAVTQTIVAFARLTRPIIWDGVDHVTLVFLVASPKLGGEENLQLLAVLAKNLLEESIRERLKVAATSTEVLFILDELK